MWARISTYDGSPESLDETTTYAREEILPPLRQMSGYRGVYSLGDRRSGKGLSITLWDSEDALRASEAEADRMRRDGAERGAGSVVSVERFEVLLHELG